MKVKNGSEVFLPQPLFPIALGIEREKRESLQLTTTLMPVIAFAMAEKIDQRN